MSPFTSVTSYVAMNGFVIEFTLPMNSRFVEVFVTLAGGRKLPAQVTSSVQMGPVMFFIRVVVSSRF